MASSRDRQRKLARAKLDRQMARRAASARRRRQTQAGLAVGAVVLLLVVGSIWFLGGFEGDEPEPTAAEPSCVWTPQDAEANEHLVEVGLPAENPPAEGTGTVTVSTSQGDLGVELDLANATCAAASIEHLVVQGFYNDTVCHEIVAESALRCGDPGGTGVGGPTYAFPGENLPTVLPPATPDGSDVPPTYPRGTVAMIGNVPGNYGSQFLIFFDDHTSTDPAYTVVGSVVTGDEVLDRIREVGATENEERGIAEPTEEIRLLSVTLGAPGVETPDEPAGPTPTPAPGPTPAPAPAATPTPSPRS